MYQARGKFREERMAKGSGNQLHLWKAEETLVMLQ